MTKNALSLTSVASLPRARRRGFRGAFTLVEILIVVAILGILASIVIPRLSNASAVARANTLRDILRYMRSQVAVYGSAHFDVFPGYPGGNTAQTPTSATFISQLTQYTDNSGNTSATSSTIYCNGPYLTQMPANPVNSLATISIIAAGAALTPDGTTGWLYQPSTGTLLPNVTGNDPGGNAYTSY